MTGSVRSIELLETTKARFVRMLVSALDSVPGLVSVTFVGSFVEKPGFDGISDIDVVVVLRSLSAASFKACRDAVAAFCAGRHGLPAERLIVNDTFGPLKFDAPGQGVVHLMVYDVAGHRQHVINSPFTCLDWERSPFSVGPTLRSLYPVLTLQPRHFFDARRSLANYLEDLASGSISFRRYEFADGTCREVTERQVLDERHAGEYAYHIVRNLVGNYAKMVRQTNARLDAEEMRAFWSEWLPGSFGLFGWFSELERCKAQRATEYPSDTLARTREFLAAFETDLKSAWRDGGHRVFAVRHAATALNDGTFLGQRRDPSLSERPAPLSVEHALAYSSPARRCRETAAALAPTARIVVDEALAEIDYGDAEGLRPADLALRYPHIVAEWQSGLDPAFPKGENTAAVSKRAEDFLARLEADDCLVVTHNVVLRCILGRRLGIEPRNWFRIPVPHLDPIELVKLGGRAYLNLTKTQLVAIADALCAAGGAG